MSIRFFRRYTTPPVAHGVQLHNGVVSVLGPRCIDELDIFAEQKRADYSQAVAKLENTILYTQLRGKNRKLAFSKRRVKRWAQDEEPTFKMRLGSEEKEIELTSRGIAEKVSMKDLKTVACGGQNAEEVLHSMNILRQVMLDSKGKGVFSHKASSFVDWSPMASLMRQAAKFGIAGPVFSLIHDKVNSILVRDVHMEMLRYYATRMPYLTKSAKSKLNEYYYKVQNTNLEQSDNGDFLCVYGLVQYGRKFGMDHVTPQLTEIIDRIQRDYMPKLLATPRQFLKTCHVTDLVLLADAVKQLDMPQYAPLAADMVKVMERLGEDKPMQVVYSTDVSEHLTKSE